jgi:hypothetical protein
VACWGIVCRCLVFKPKRNHVAMGVEGVHDPSIVKVKPSTLCCLHCCFATCDQSLHVLTSRVAASLSSLSLHCWGC